MIATKGHSNNIGLEKWIKEYNIKIEQQAELRKNALDTIKSYDEEEQKSKQKTGNTDDEGWTMVTKKGRNPGLSRKESVGNKLSAKIEAGSKRKELPNFYRFQLKESKIKHIEQLRKQFELDKQKVNALKQTRKFKP